MPTAENQAETPDTGGERSSYVGRALALPSSLLAAARRNRLLSLVLVSGAVMILGSTASVLPYVWQHRPLADGNVTIEAALALLDAGKYEEAKQMASRLRTKLEGTFEQLGYPLFVQGAILAQEASQLSDGEERETSYLVAARYLEESRGRGFPAGREAEGLYLLGTSLINAREYAASLPVLLEAFRALPRQKYELAHRLSTAYLRDSSPNLKQAAHYNRIWLEDPTLDAYQRATAWLQLAEIALKQQDAAACEAAFQNIAEDSPLHDRVLVLQARLAMAKADTIRAQTGAVNDDARAAYATAIELLRQASSKQSSDLSGTAMRQASYLLGVCHTQRGDLEAARTAFEKTRRVFYRTSEALVATLTEAEITQQQGNKSDSLELYLKVLQEVGPALLLENEWLPMRDLLGRLTVAQRKFVNAADFEHAQTLAEALTGLFPPDEAVLLQAETHQAWGEHLARRAATETPTAGLATQAHARQQFRLAGARYQELAQLRFATPEYPNDLWKSGNSFRLGQNYSMAIRMLRQHMANIPRKNSAPALVALGDSYLALEQYETALTELDTCIASFPKHPATYEARILASLANQELGNLEQAAELLIDNIHNSLLDPRSRYWQDSLFAYGKLLFQQGLLREVAANEKLAESRSAAVDVNVTEMQEPSPNAAADQETKQQEDIGFQELKEAHDLFQQAIATLEETVAREERLALAEHRRPNTSEARYLIAEAFRHAAVLPRESLRTERAQTRRNTLRHEMRQSLQEAAQHHQLLQEQLARKQNQTELTPVEQRILRNTYFAHADTLFALEDYDAAIGAYVAATNRYQDKPVALEALMQISCCYRHLGSISEARGTLRQAQSVLKRIQNSDDFTETTRYSRKEWEQLIAWLSEL